VIEVMKWIPVFALAFLGWITAAAPARAQEMKIAVVNFQEVLMEHPKSKALVARLKSEGDKAANELKRLATRFEELDKEYEKLRGKPVEGKINVLPPAIIQRRIDIQQEAMKIQEETSRIDNENRTELNKQRVTGLLEVSAEVRALVIKANAGRYALVFDTSALSRDGYPQLLDFPGAVDITNEVIKLLPEQ